MTGVIYARYSSDNQREESIDGQIRECRAFAKRNDIHIVGTYIDRALSAKTDNRPDFQKMIKDSSKHEFDCIIVWKLDRFARNRYDSAHYKNILKKNNVRVISATEAISQGAEGILLESVLEGMAEYYSVELAEKINRGLTENALKCKYNGGSLALGYTTDKEQNYHINPDTAPIVREIFERYKAGMTQGEIAKALNNKGLRNQRGTKFNINSIARILSNRRYIGEYIYSNTVIPNGIPAIISRELFDDVQEILVKNKKAPAKHKAEDDYLLTTKLYCGKCMSFMVGESGTSKTGLRYSYYKCITAKRKKTCDKKAIKKDWIENIVVQQIKETLLDQTLIDELIDGILNLLNQENNIIPILKKELAEVDKSINNIVAAIEQGIFTKATKQRLDELESRKEQLEIQIIEENITQPTLTRNQLKFWFERLKKLNPNKLEDRRRLIDTFVNSIIVYDDRIEFYFNYKGGAKTLTKTELDKFSDLFSSTPPENSVHESVRNFHLFTINYSLFPNKYFMHGISVRCNSE